MKKASLLTTYILIVFIILLTGCKDKETDIDPDIKIDTMIHTTEGVKDQTKEEIRLKAEELVKDDTYGKFSGSILLAKNDQVVFKGGYGLADDDNANTPQTIFQVGTITKQFTAAAIYKLKEKGLLATQDKISKYIPDYPNGNKITIKDLLNNTSGIPEYSILVKDTEPGKHTYTPKELIEIFKDKPLSFEPGTNSEYSNSNYILLGYIIEKVSGTSYEDYIKTNIFTPLGMNNSGMLNNKDKVKGMAIGYSHISSDSKGKSSGIEPSLLYSTGEAYSTVEDLLIWYNNLRPSKLLSESSLNEMFTLSMGWFPNRTLGDDTVSNSGSIGGFTSYISRNASNGYLVIILSNKATDKSAMVVADILLQTVKGK
jgi:CubicO group peptidase (beta-lactamase class C family)